MKMNFGYRFLTFITCGLFYFVLTTQASNTVSVGTYSVQPLTEFSVQLSVDASSPFVAFQCDLQLPVGYKYIENSASLADDRVDGHAISVSLLTGNIVRVLAYSAANKAFKGSGGTLVTLRLKSAAIPATSALNLTNVLVSDAQSQNIVNEVVAGSVTVLSPDLKIGADSLSFGRVALLSSSSQYIELRNDGNQLLNIQSIRSNESQFSTQYENGLQLDAGQSIMLDVVFNPTSKGTKNAVLTVSSNDPDKPVQTIRLIAVAYAVNQLHVGQLSGSSGTNHTLEISINNMEPLTGFQFDLQLPEVLRFQNGGQRLLRSDDHQVSVSTIGSNVLRVIAYSTGNRFFSGSSGKIAELDFQLVGNSGYYSLNVSNALIADASGANIISDAYGNAAIITSSDIESSSQLGFGDVSVLTPKLVQHSIYNYGQEPLLIESLSFSSSAFTSTASFPITVLPWNSVNIPVICSITKKGSLNGTMRIFSNDPDESPFQVQLNATGIVPNYIKVVASELEKGKNGFVEIEVENYDSCVALQCDIRIPEGINWMDEVLPELTNRKRDHIISHRLVSPQLMRVLIYSPGQQYFKEQSGVLFRVPCFVNSEATNGSYTIQLENAILSNGKMENVLYGVQGSDLQVVNPLKKLHISLFLEGLYMGNGLMREAQTVTGPKWGNGNSDIVRVELRSANDVNNMLFVRDSVLVSTTGQAQIDIPATFTSSCYILIKHRFSIVTCSASPVSFESQEINYSFTDNAVRAFGANQSKLADGIVGIYSGELNGDGFINILDRGLLLTDLNAARVGYLPANLNGDVYINILDRGIIMNNLNKGVTALLPEGMNP